MTKQAILGKLKDAILELDDEKVNGLIKEGMQAGLLPGEIVVHGLSPGLAIIGDEFVQEKRFLSDLVIAAEIMNDATVILRPAMEGRSSEELGETMIIGTVEGDLHSVGKRIVAALFTGAGYRVVDIGENVPASKFAEAAKEHNATLVGASAVVSPSRAECGLINKALVEAGIRDKLIYIVGGWAMTQDWSDRVGADAYAKDAVLALAAVSRIKKGEVPRVGR